MAILDKLMEVAHLEGCKQMIVETTQAQELYVKRGFQTIRQRRERGILLDVMSLDLKSIRIHS